ncbi:hypothetical protein JOF56_005723 [Kibdelosporangium banguiense]|uniref:Terminase small subunit n=1 Tax=Kibdelosporangium banguiense TaxID=1365924 RepID=A0ABS4TLN6_9PSEU|nr:hypothetical protein [Kibdelosporangium banguiense]MBP2325338.1 hypothetical protein [Kibdelosporangium banguiense]
MAGRGPTPKDPSKRRRRNVDPTPTTVVVTDGEVRGPELPDTVDWPEQTRRWWNTWRTSPQAQSMTPTDWDFLLDTALLHAELWSGVASVAPELRLRVGKLGATPEDRQRLRMQIIEPGDAPPPSSRPGRYSHLKVVSEQDD